MVDHSVSVNRSRGDAILIPTLQSTSTLLHLFPMPTTIQSTSERLHCPSALNWQNEPRTELRQQNRLRI
ncbi:hypothetical protein BDZ91DRAFT_721690 [Kalaharituber pfeilii]|nr:hypothetical protein BDZ91DRAFT_721690 [Kalaharituber pfeilii]